MIGLFLPQEAHRPRDFKGWPLEAKALTRPRYRGKVSDSTPLKGNAYLAIACHGPRITHNQFAPLELLVSLVRQLFTASQKRRCKKIIMDGELIKETSNLIEMKTKR